MSSSQAGATSGTTVSGVNVSQGSSQEKRHCDECVEQLDSEPGGIQLQCVSFVFALFAFSLLPNLTFPRLSFFFSRYSGAGFKLRAWSTCFLYCVVFLFVCLFVFSCCCTRFVFFRCLFL